MSRSRIGWLLGVALLGVCVGACTVPVGEPVPKPEPVPTPEPEEPAPTAPAEDLKALAEGNNAFAIDLYKELAKTEKGNIVVSPYSIRTALGMTYAGARGQTAEEMRKVLHFTLPDDKLHPAFGAAAHQLQGGKDKPYQLNVANALWGQKGAPFRPEFLELTKKNYAGGFRELDFAKDPDAARQTINRWVEEKTQDKIKELLRQGDVQKYTSLILVNAVYFKGTWAKPFSKEHTIDDKFRVSVGKLVPVRMMQANCEASYFEGDGVQVLSLPYRDYKQSLVVILPAEGKPLAEVEQRLTATLVRDWLNRGTREDVQVALPRVHTRWRSDLGGLLQGLGMRAPFGPNADFAGISSEGQFEIGRVLHEAVIEVSEEGTVAAAATAVATTQPIGGRIPRNIVFRADRPFVYLLVDHSTQTVLFMGRMATPVVGK